MGAKVHCENYLPGYRSMREFDHDSGKSNWPLSYCDKPLSNGLYFEHLPSRSATNTCPIDNKDVVKETMLEHDAVFKGQVSELHRLYRVQRDMMDGDRRTDMHRHLMNMDTSSTSSSMAGYQMPPNDSWKWQKPNSSLADSILPSPSVSGYSKGNNNTHTTASQDRFSSKVGDMFDSRPSKVRKRLFDLELPAEDYVDTEEEEQTPGHKMSDHSRYSPGRYHNVSYGNKMESNRGGGVKTSSYKNGSTSAYLRDSIALADSGKTIQVEEANRPRSVNFVDIRNLDSTAKPKSHFLLGLSEQNLRSTDESYYMKDRLDRGWLPYMNDPGYNKTYYSSSQALQIDKSHVSSPTSGNHPYECNGRDSCLDRTICDLEVSERNHHQSSFNYQKPVAASRALNPYLFPYVPEDSKNNWSLAASTPDQAGNSLTRVLTSSQVSSSSLLGPSSRTIQSCVPSSETFKDKSYLSGGYGSNKRFECGRPNYNSFHDCSASGSKETTIRLPSVGSGSLNWIKEDKVSELSSKCGLENYSKAPNPTDMKPAIDLDLNTCLEQYRADVEIVHKERKYDKGSEGLPWLKRKSSTQNEGSGTRRNINSLESSLPQAASTQLCNKNGTVKDPIQEAAFHGDEVGSKRSKVDNTLVNRKIFGFPMFDKPSTSNTESCLPSPQDEAMKNDQGDGAFDLNVAFDIEQSTKEDLVTEKESDTSVSKFKNFDLNSCLTDDEATLEPSSPGACIDNSIVAYDPKSVGRSTGEAVAEGQIGKRVVIDLNSCVTEDEVTLEPSCSSADINVKTRFVIDLEVPAAPESEEETVPIEEQVLQDMAIESSLHKVPKFHDETLMTAAEAIVAISSDKRNHDDESVDPSTDTLFWFADVVSSRRINMVLDLSGEIDEFEAMALNLTELKEEDYMPKPLFPESLKVEETRTLSSPHQARRGRGRRGRQRKDFQRDILPSLVSLSRHEVTRDLQMFGGMMQATGHSWNVDTTRRSRGRPRRSP